MVTDDSGHLSGSQWSMRFLKTWVENDHYVWPTYIKCKKKIHLENVRKVGISCLISEFVFPPSLPIPEEAVVGTPLLLHSQTWIPICACVSQISPVITLTRSPDNGCKWIHFLKAPYSVSQDYQEITHQSRQKEEFRWGQCRRLGNCLVRD